MKLNVNSKVMDISVIVPLYKGNKYIPKVVAMLEDNMNYLNMHQKYIEMELLFINDYPFEEIDEVFSKQVTVKYLYNETNRGIHETRIKGLHVSRGKYVHILDQDDVIKYDFYYTQIEAIKENDVVVCNGYYRGNKLIFESEMKEFQKKILIQQGCKIISPGQTLIKKDSIPTEWMENIIQNSGCDDWLLWILMVYKNANFSYNPQLSYFHVENGQNQSFHWDKMSLSLKEIREILQKQSIADEEMKMQSLKCIERFIYDYETFYQFEKTWNSIDEKKIFKFLSENNIRYIAVYGYGNIGKRLIPVLKKYDSSVWAMDRDLRYVDEAVKIYRPEDEIPKVDLIIVTPLRGGKQIQQFLEEKKEIRDSWLLEDFLCWIEKFLD